MDTHLPPRWKERVQWGLNAIVTEQNNRFLEAQQRAEGGSAKWNPLNSTLKLAGFTEAVDYNKVGVRNYMTPNGGVAATVLTLSQLNSDGSLKYGKIMGALQSNFSSGKLAEEMVQDCRSQIAMWGTNVDLILEILKEI